MDDVFKQLLTLYLIALLVFVQMGIYLAAKLSGWGALAKKHILHDAPFIQYKKFQSIRMGWCNYSGILNLAVTPAGLYMKMFFLLKTGHPPLFLPWEIFKGAKKSRWGFLLGHIFYVEADNREVKLRLPRGISEEILSNHYVELRAN